MQESFNNIDDFLSTLPSSDPSHSSNPQQYENDLYKKWFRSKSQSGFLALRPWYKALKLKVDIGKTSPEGKLISSTNVFVDIIDFAAYLSAIANCTAVNNFPANDRMGIPTDEGFVSYGGGMIDNKPVSRIFKAHYWQSGDTYDSSSFVWKCGHFAARKSDSGAFIPDMKQMISMDSIKVTRQDVCSISYLVDLALNSYTSNNIDWYSNESK
jgi:hypothetical protein